MDLFDGPVGFLTAMIMASANAGAEREAVAILAPAPADRILAVGFGPGVGVSALAERLTAGQVLGVDPSAAMMKAAARRNARLISAGRVRLARTTAADIPVEEASLDGAIAVNSLQFCEPIVEVAAELARVLRPGAKLVSLTHDWAAARHAGTAKAWVARTRAALAEAGFSAIDSYPAKAEKGHAIVLAAVRGGTGEG